jgi:tRNA(Ile2) C34 agmatinyltransferase TiaS
MSEKSFEDFKANLDKSTIGQLVAELKMASENCPQCGGSREYTFTSRGRDNVVNCLRCEPVYKLLETLNPILELIRDDSPY